VKPKWSFDGMFPVIARAIGELHNQQFSFVTHEQIVKHLLQDSEALSHIDVVLAESVGGRSPESSG
jgi:hypothetical protein